MCSMTADDAATPRTAFHFWLEEADCIHALQSAPAHKLPALYLLDSIVKNIGLPYTALFASGLPQVTRFPG